VVRNDEEPLWDDEVVEHEPPFDDPFVRRFVQTTVHVRRYLPFYGGALAWVLVMLLVQPIGGGTDGSPLAGPDASGRRQARAVGSVRPPTESVTSAFSSTPSLPTFAGVLAGGDGSASSGFSFDDELDSGSSFAGGDFDFDSSSDLDTGPDPLRIVGSGYASATAGTPLEPVSNPSATGLPVASEGTDTKRSFLRLTGDDSVLRLKLATDPGANRFEPVAAVKACPITAASWEPARAMTFSAAPAYDCMISVAGARDAATGEWTFDLHPFLGDALARGVALVPASRGMFQVTFAPSAVTSVNG
jgi:hypothetical protein